MSGDFLTVSFGHSHHRFDISPCHLGSSGVSTNRKYRSRGDDLQKIRAGKNSGFGPFSKFRRSTGYPLLRFGRDLIRRDFWKSEVTTPAWNSEIGACCLYSGPQRFALLNQRSRLIHRIWEPCAYMAHRGKAGAQCGARVVENQLQGFIRCPPRIDTVINGVLRVAIKVNVSIDQPGQTSESR